MKAKRREQHDGQVVPRKLDSCRESGEDLCGEATLGIERLR